MNWHYLFTSYRQKVIKLCVSLKNIGKVYSCFLWETDTGHVLSSSGDGHLIQEWTGNFRPITGKLLKPFTSSGKLSSSIPRQLKQLFSVHRTFTASEADSSDAHGTVQVDPRREPLRTPATLYSFPNQKHTWASISTQNKCWKEKDKTENEKGHQLHRYILFKVNTD